MSTFDEDLSGWDMSAATNINSMFASCTAYTGIGIAAWDVSNVFETTTMMFSYVAIMILKCWCSISPKAQSSFLQFFCNDSEASNFDANLGSWDLSKVTHMSAMFFQATSFRGVGLSSWDTSRLSYAPSM